MQEAGPSPGPKASPTAYPRTESRRSASALTRRHHIPLGLSSNAGLETRPDAPICVYQVFCVSDQRIRRCVRSR